MMNKTKSIKRTIPTPEEINCKNEATTTISTTDAATTTTSTITARTVRFSDVLQISAIPSPLDQEPIIMPSILWYTASELGAIRDRARDVCYQRKIQMKVISSTFPNATTTTRSIPYSVMKPFSKDCITSGSSSSSGIVRQKDLNVQLDSSMRGLEQRMCFERQRRKVATIRFIVKISSKLQNKYQQYHNDNESLSIFRTTGDTKLAEVSTKITKWASDVAWKEAYMDYIHAYGVYCSDEIDYFVRNNTTNNNSRSRKRCLVASSSYSTSLTPITTIRHVRARTI